MGRAGEILGATPTVLPVPVWETRQFWDGALIGLAIGAVVMLVAVWAMETWG